MKIKIAISIIAATALLSCGRESVGESANVAPMAEIAYEVLELPEGEVDEYVAESAAPYPTEYLAMMKVTGCNSASEWIRTDAVRVFAPAVDSLGVRTNDVAQELGAILGNAERLGLEIGMKGYATAVWGKPQSILMCDSVMLIALNHYLGAEYEGYSSMPAYRRATKTPKMLPYDMAEALVATRYPYKETEEAKVINRLVYEGILTEAKMQLVADADESGALGYSEEDLKWLEENESEIWRQMVGTKMIFDGSESVAGRLVDPSPATLLISNNTPGRAGRYIGYKIVKAYLDSHPDVGLSGLLNGELYTESNPLSKAGYTPK